MSYFTGQQGSPLNQTYQFIKPSGYTASADYQASLGAINDYNSNIPTTISAQNTSPITSPMKVQDPNSGGGSSAALGIAAGLGAGATMFASQQRDTMPSDAGYQQAMDQSSPYIAGAAGAGGAAVTALTGNPMLGSLASAGITNTGQNIAEARAIGKSDPSEYVWQSGQYREGEMPLNYFEQENPYADASEYKFGEIAKDAFTPMGAVNIASSLFKRKKGREQSARFKEAQQRARDTYAYQKRVFEEERQKMKQKGAEQASMRNRMMGGMDSPASDLYGY